MQDSNPLPWGAQDQYQAHFIVRKEIDANVGKFLAQTKLITSGRFSSKKIEKIEWLGNGSLAQKLNDDNDLNGMLAKQSLRDASIFIEPTDGAVRIRNKWKNHIDFGITKDLFEIYDRIAGHIKSI